MAKLTKNRKESLTKFESEKLYSLKEASDVVKSFSKLKFDSSVDLAVNLGVDPKKADQNVRGIVSLPNGTGKDVKVLALVTPDKEDEAKKAGADFVGLDEFLKKIKDGWTDVDVIITMPSVMGKLGPLGKILGPRGLMPNPKTGTVTMNVGKAVQETKAGKIDFNSFALCLYLIADAAGGHAASQLPHPIQRSSIILRDEGIASVGQTGTQRLHLTQASVSIKAFLTW